MHGQHRFLERSPRAPRQERRKSTRDSSEALSGRLQRFAVVFEFVDALFALAGPGVQETEATELCRVLEMNRFKL